MFAERMTYPEQDMLDAYIECALWSSTDGEEHLDANYGREDIAPETLASMRSDVEGFASRHRHLLGDMTDSQAGHDFWLTRNRHGAGFWDRGLGRVGDLLTDASDAYGEVELYVGDDGRIYA